MVVKIVVKVVGLKKLAVKLIVKFVAVLPVSVVMARLLMASILLPLVLCLARGMGLVEVAMQMGLTPS